ncbi:MAG TPA: hypothetical protein VJ939_00775, partial [Bacteroidales bacterium]|nr:hypothetical protein [Bacteroidales bacterium]
MKNKKGLYGLLHDCKYPYTIREPARPAKASKKESPFEEAEVIEGVEKEEEFFDQGEPLTMTMTSDFLYAQSTEASSYGGNDHYDQEYVHDQNENQSSYEEEIFTGDSEAFYVEPFSTLKKEKSVSSQPEERASISPKEKTQEEAVYLPEKPSDEEKSTIDISTRNIEEDIRAIMQQQKDYDSFQKKKTQPKPDPNPSNPPEGPSSEPSIDDVLKNEHQIFDKIAQSMKMANAYDLGSIALENRLDTFDEEMEIEEKKKDPATKALADPPAVSAQVLSTEEFLSDLDKMPSSKAADIQSGSSALFTAGKNGVEVYKDTYRQKTVFHFKAGLVVEEEDASEAYPSKAVNTPLVFLADGPKFKEENVEKGDFASVYCCRTQKLVHAVIGDHGRGDLGAGSLFLAKALLGQDPAPDDENKTGHP